MAITLYSFPDMIYERVFNGGKSDNNGLAKDISFEFDISAMALPASLGSSQSCLKYRM